MDSSLPDSAAYGIFQARILSCQFPSSSDLPHPGIKPGSPALQADSLTEPRGKPISTIKHSVYSRPDRVGAAKKRKYPRTRIFGREMHDQFGSVAQSS